MELCKRFYDVAGMVLPFEQLLKAVPRDIAAAATEIRIRAGRQIVIETLKGRYICGTRTADAEEIYTCIKNFCNFSIHSCQRELSEGWITLKGGHRAGFTGTAYIKDNKIETIKDISSLNIRIAREYTGISDIVFYETVNNDNFRGLIISGAPLSGKTTFLRDFCRNLGMLHKTALVDERGEIAAVYKGIPQNDVGLNTDVINCFPKKIAIEQAVRVLSPEFVVCDEIGSDTSSLIDFAGNGVKIIVSIHCGDIGEAVYNNAIYDLLNSGAVNYITFLDRRLAEDNVKGLWFTDGFESINSCDDNNNLLRRRHGNVSKAENAC